MHDLSPVFMDESLAFPQIFVYFNETFSGIRKWYKRVMVQISFNWINKKRLIEFITFTSCGFLILEILLAFRQILIFFNKTFSRNMEPHQHVTLQIYFELNLDTYLGLLKSIIVILLFISNKKNFIVIDAIHCNFFQDELMR